MVKSLVDKKEIKLAILGMVDGNGHPYSWSAIFNGYDPLEMSKCPYKAIPEYLEKEEKSNWGIEGCKVTHVWADDPQDAVSVAKASFIPNILKNPEDAIGQVDAVIIATDKGYEHVDRCRPFEEAGPPVFVDKPLVDNDNDLLTFNKWVHGGAKIMSSSCMRYCKEFMPYRLSTNDLGEVRYISITTPKTWERYAIHALEGIYPILGPGFISVQNTGSFERNFVHIQHEKGVDVNIVAIDDMLGGLGVLQIVGTVGRSQAVFRDIYFAFKSQLESFIQYLRSGVRPFPFAETQELMKLIIAGIRSREERGRLVRLDEIK